MDGNGPIPFRAFSNLSFNWTGNLVLTRSIESSKEVDEERNAGNSSAVFSWHEKAESSREKAPGHIWERRQKEIAAAESIHGVNCWKGKNEEDKAKPHGGKEAAKCWVASLNKNGWTVKGHAL